MQFVHITYFFADIPFCMLLLAAMVFSAVDVGIVGLVIITNLKTLSSILGYL